MLKRALFLAVLCVTPSLTLAASGDVLTGSGSGAAAGSGAEIRYEGDLESATLKARRADRAKDLRTLLLQTKTADAQFRERVAAFQRKRAETRATCRDDLRASNRDTRLPILLQCYGAELSAERDLLAKQKTYVQAMPGVTAGIKTQALTRLDQLDAALDAIRFAIESGVYASPDDLMEAKKNLLARYRIPAADALAAARADRAGSIAGSLIIRLDAARAAEIAATGSARADWTDARHCLSQAETALETLAANASADRNTATKAGTDELLRCIDLVLPLEAPYSPTPASGSGAVTGSGSIH